MNQRRFFIATLLLAMLHNPKPVASHPDSFVSADKLWLNFAFDDNRHRAIHYSAKLPPLPPNLNK